MISSLDVLALAVVVLCRPAVCGQFLLLCAGVAAELRQQADVVGGLQLRLVSLPGRRAAARQHIPQQTLQNRRRRQQVSLLSFSIHTLYTQET